MKEKNILTHSKKKVKCDTCEKVFNNIAAKKIHKCEIIEKTTNENGDYICQYCDKIYKREASYIKHTCKSKERFLIKDKKYVKLAYDAYRIFYKKSMNHKVAKTYSDFSKSSLFNDFCKFGMFAEKNYIINFEKYIIFLLKNTTPLKDWNDVNTYNAWVKTTINKETPTEAIQRSVLLMKKWSDYNNEPITSFFSKIDTALAVQWIKSGRLSPWILYCGVGKILFSRLSDKQLKDIQSWINPILWGNKVKENQSEVDMIKIILNDIGVK